MQQDLRRTFMRLHMYSWADSGHNKVPGKKQIAERSAWLKLTEQLVGWWWNNSYFLYLRISCSVFRLSPRDPSVHSLEQEMEMIGSRLNLT